ncbi:MAG: hypothetical protein Q8O10_04150 [candidate division Zixibacteria bacterium]|nr:hypothetical protein [candidate division Zixibacteria bacterium]
MSELNADEHRLLKLWFCQYANPFQRHQKGYIIAKLVPNIMTNARIVMEGLIQKKVLSESPDKAYICLTDFGYELYLHFEQKQRDWNEQEIVKVSDVEKDEILIRKGDIFRGYWIIRNIFLSAQKSIVIQDNYLSPELFKLLSEIQTGIDIKILTSDKQYKEKDPSELAYTKLKQQNNQIEMRKSNNFHGRYIFIDRQFCWEIGHSIKDLGTKDATIKKLRNCEELYTEFEKLWLD